MPLARRSLAVGAQATLAGLALWFAAQAFTTQWDALRRTTLDVRPHWGLITTSAIVVLGAYTLLIAIWRGVIRVWGARLPFLDAAHIWFVSNLGRYIPGKVWQIGAMGMMAQQRGVAPVAAVGSALLLTLVNLVAGFAVVFVAGIQVFEAAGASRRAVQAGTLAAAGAALAVLASPAIVPKVAAIAERLTGRSFRIPSVPARAVWLAALGNVAAWLLYGAAFRLFALGVVGQATGGWATYTAVYTGSYLVGYLVLFAPGGLVFREAAMIAGLTKLGLATAAEAALIAVASRVWLTVLEIVPGTLFLALGAARPAPPKTLR